MPTIKLPDGQPKRPINMLRRTLAPQTIVHAHSHNWGQFIYAYEGTLDITTPDGRYLAPPNRGVWVPSNTPHEVSTLGGAELSSVYITVEESASLEKICQVVEVSGLLRELIFEALQRPISYDWLSQTGRLFRIVRDQIASAKAVPLHLPFPRDSRLLKVCASLQRDPGNQDNLECWGNHVGASERTLQRLFQKETGISFRSWRQQLRLQVALQRLVTTSDSITHIASDLGYESSSAFIAMFKGQLGVTPGGYSRSLNRKNL